MVLVEAGLLGFLSNVLGLALGFALSFVLIYVINKQSFGWTIQFHPPLLLLAASAFCWCGVSQLWLASIPRSVAVAPQSR